MPSFDEYVLNTKKASPKENQIAAASPESLSQKPAKRNIQEEKPKAVANQGDNALKVNEIRSADTDIKNDKVNKENKVNIASIVTIPGATSYISGRVTDEKGMGVKDATLELLMLTNGKYLVVEEAQSNDKGEYLFADLMAGSYTLQVYKDGYLPYQSSRITVMENQYIGINLSLKNDLRNLMGNIHGVITDEATGLPLENILVALFSVSNNREIFISSTYTNQQGKYAFTLINPAVYVVKATSFRKDDA